MTTPQDIRQIWGDCYVAKCPEVGMRCRWGYCKACCEDRHRNADGEPSHAPWSEQDIRDKTPIYTPTAPKLVGETRWEEVA